MFMNYIIIAIIIVILVALGSALISMIRGGAKDSDRLFSSLKLRIMLSIFLFLFLIIAGFLGWIEPNAQIF